MKRNFTSQDLSNIHKSILLISALVDTLVENGVITPEERSKLIDRANSKDDEHFTKYGWHLINRYDKE